MNSLQAKAQEENRVWDWNKADPYLQAARVASQLRDSGTKNLYSGVSNAAGAGAEMASPDFNSSLLMGGRKGNTQEPSLDEVMNILSQIKNKQR
jgi:hypothetical protein